jgi:hypothetical protein
LPDLDPGVTVLRTAQPRSAVLHRLALQTVRQTDGRVYWVDARNTASTYALNELAAHRRLLERVRVARAFTAYQHVGLVERLVDTVTPQTGCLVVPNAPSLYRDDDVPAHEATPLFEAVVGALHEVCTTYDIRLLVSDARRDDDLADILASAADATYRAEATDLGYRVEGADFETTVYWDDTGWQTTIPYWVELYGAATETYERAQPGPVTPAMLGG